jgi:RNA-directed DNA polymerase
VLTNILEHVECSDEAHGFIRGKSIVSNAEPHVRREIVINLDMLNFFPTITFGGVKGLFCSLGYSEHVATTLALLCTEPPRVAAEFNGKVYHVALGQRVLPQGACTRPAITNAICRKLDRRLLGLSRKLDYS